MAAENSDVPFSFQTRKTSRWVYLLRSKHCKSRRIWTIRWRIILLQNRHQIRDPFQFKKISQIHWGIVAQRNLQVRAWSPNQIFTPIYFQQCCIGLIVTEPFNCRPRWASVDTKLNFDEVFPRTHKYASSRPFDWTTSRLPRKIFRRSKHSITGTALRLKTPQTLRPNSKLWIRE